MPVNDLKAIRLRRSMNVSELAEKSGISRQTIYEIENGTRKNVRISTLSRLADALDYPLDDIVIFFFITSVQQNEHKSNKKAAPACRPERQIHPVLRAERCNTMIAEFRQSVNRGSQ